MSWLRIWLPSIAFAGLLLSGCGSGESGSAGLTRTTDPPMSAPSRTADGQVTASSSPATVTAAVTAGCPSAISWSDAIDHVGEQATVRGPVKGTNYATRTKGKPTFIDVGKAYPDPARFTVLIWGADRGTFPVAPEKAFSGRIICVTGLITSYKGGAEIEVSSPAAIVVE